MTDEKHAHRAVLEATALAESAEHQQRLWNALLADDSVRTPHIVAHALAEVLAKWLVAMEIANPGNRSFCNWLVNQVPTQVHAHREEHLAEQAPTAPEVLH